MLLDSSGMVQFRSLRKLRTQPPHSLLDTGSDYAQSPPNNLPILSLPRGRRLWLVGQLKLLR